MRVVVPHTRIHPLTDVALREVAPDAERVFLGSDPIAYSRLLEELWAAREPFLIVEHDIEPTAEALRQALQCECWWSTSPYRGAGKALIDQALGFTRFRSELMGVAPDVVARANRMDDGGPQCPPGHWQRLDARLVSVLRNDGYHPHHHVEVPHHHVYDYGCACGEVHE